MPNNLHFLLSTFSLILLNHLVVLVTAEDACPYPCNPPPIPGTITPTTPAGSYPPPTYSLPPPSGNYPNYPPPYGNFPNYPPGGNYGSGLTPPPPDPILPYFPYYYRNGPRQPSDQSSSSMSSALVKTPTVLIFLASIIVMLLFSPLL